MGKKMLRGWQGLKAGRGVGSGRWGGWTGRRGDGERWMATGRGRQGGRIWKGTMGRERWGGEQQGWEEVGNGEGGNGEGGEDGKGAMGGWKGERGGDGHGEKKGQEISQMNMMGCLGGHRL